MSEKNTKKPAPGATNKKASVTTKAAPKKKTSSVKKASVKATSVDTSMQDIIAEMNQQRISRDGQISSLIEEVGNGFSSLSDRASEQEEKHHRFRQRPCWWPDGQGSGK